MGIGSSDIDTTRRDFGNDQTIVGKTSADIDYYHGRVSTNYNKGKFSIKPSLSYKSMTMDINSFIDDRPDDVSSVVEIGETTIFSEGNATLSVTDDNIKSRSVNTEMLELGINITGNFNKVYPYLSFAYVFEDTTKASYKEELETDTALGSIDIDKLAPTSYNSSYKISIGTNVIIGSFIKAGISIGSINNRNDWEEQFMSAKIKIGF